MTSPDSGAQLLTVPSYASQSQVPMYISKNIQNSPTKTGRWDCVTTLAGFCFGITESHMLVPPHSKFTSSHLVGGQAKISQRSVYLR